jgi:hypothetical protein
VLNKMNIIVFYFSSDLPFKSELAEEIQLNFGILKNSVIRIPLVAVRN